MGARLDVFAFGGCDWALDGECCAGFVGLVVFYLLWMVAVLVAVLAWWQCVAWVCALVSLLTALSWGKLDNGVVGFRLW